MERATHKRSQDCNKMPPLADMHCKIQRVIGYDRSVVADEIVADPMPYNIQYLTQKISPAVTRLCRGT